MKQIKIFDELLTIMNIFGSFGIGWFASHFSLLIFLLAIPHLYFIIYITLLKRR